MFNQELSIFGFSWCSQVAPCWFYWMIVIGWTRMASCPTCCDPLEESKTIVNNISGHMNKNIPGGVHQHLHLWNPWGAPCKYWAPSNTSSMLWLHHLCNLCQRSEPSHFPRWAPQSPTAVMRLSGCGNQWQTPCEEPSQGPGLKLTEAWSQIFAAGVQIHAFCKHFPWLKVYFRRQNSS